MAEIFTPLTTSNLTNQTSITAAIDSNFAAIASLLPDVVSRTAVNPNSMLGSLDMNSNPILNLPAPVTVTSPVRLVDVTNGVTLTTISPASYARFSSQPGNPASTTSTTPLMAGLGATISPHVTGNVLAIVSLITSATFPSGGVVAGIQSGTGGIPVNGQSIPGGSVGVGRSLQNNSTFDTCMTLTGYITGLALNTPRWFDLFYSTLSGGSAFITSITFTLIEV